MGLLAFSGLTLILLAALSLYVRLNNRRLTRLPEEVVALSPQRLTPESVRERAGHLAKSPPITIKEQLPPRTGRRYIVVGGGGFLGGWIVASLLERGEDPECIRILDIRPPVREDLLSAQIKGLEFIQVDITDAAAVEAAFTAPWPSSITQPGGTLSELTVFHTAANIRFYERHEIFLPNSEKVNVRGTENVVNSARSVGASILIYTSSGSVAVRRSRFFLWPWEKEPQHFVQVITDDENALPKQHNEFFSNYAVTKIRADRLVRAADKSRSGTGVLRTGCIRPGNGVFGSRGDMLCGAYLVRQTNPTWIANTMQSFCYVENCVLAHLCFEQRLAERQAGGANPDIGGQAFMIADPGPVPTYGDVYTTLETLTDGECTFPKLPPTLMLAVATFVEWYYLGRQLLISNGYAIGKKLPPITGDLVNLQPSLFALTSVHLIFDDSRARLPPEKGGLGYKGAWTTFEGLYKTVEEHLDGVGRAGRRSDLAGVSLGFGMGKAQRAVAKANDKVVDGLGVDPVKILSTK
ncbi:3-beta hydroxysteroid dehydrogenase/isomerase family-domain-containing protein [Lyophyllum atratum]|nr:3-beta hydroxysteroid dehydrogenase/isomerase family-domain-containing protein [Lyophyllum atratum]